MKKRPGLPWDDDYVSAGMPGGGGLAELESRLRKELELEKEKEKEREKAKKEEEKEAVGEAEKGGEGGQGEKEGKEKGKKQEERGGGKPGSKERELFAVQVKNCFLDVTGFVSRPRGPGTIFLFVL